MKTLDYYFIRFFAYGFSFFIVAEWLRPILHVTQSSYYGVFLFFIGLSLILYFIRLPFWLSTPIKLIFAFFLPYAIFYHSAYTLRSFGLYWQEQWELNRLALQQWDIQLLTNDFHTFLSFLLLWMFTYFIYYWIDTLHRVRLFVSVTIFFFVFLVLLEAPVGKFEFVRILLYSIGLLVSVEWLRRYTIPHLTWNRKAFMKGVTSFLAVTIAIFSISFVVLPAEDDGKTWSWFMSWTDKKEQAKSGYREDDTSLGGAFEPNDAHVMDVDLPTRQYYRLETKETYTSKGWEGSSAKKWDAATGEEGEATATFHMKRDLPYVPIVYGWTGKSEAAEGMLYQVAREERHVFQNDNEETLPLTTYSLQYDPPVYDETNLRTWSLEDYDLTEEEMKRYTQLPERLPSRLYDRAEQITKDAPTVYDKVKAIEQYFKQSGYTYDREDVPYPEGSEDYVDQFVFETKRGYCDNYSSSMVVLLRTLDIPARWAKGYASGTYDEKREQAKITENDAHSWVEVYFPSYGWIPFEPTVGFESPATFERSFTEESDPEKAEEEIPPAETEQLYEEEEKEETQEPASTEKKKSSSLIYVVCLIAIGLLLLAAFYFVYRKKKKEVDSVTTFQETYRALLKQLDKKGWPRAKYETLQQYARRIDEQFETTALQELTKVYERQVYGTTSTQEEWASYEALFNWYNHRLRVDLSKKEQ